MLVEKIVAAKDSPVVGVAVADALKARGIGTTVDTLAQALRHQLHQVADEPFAALAASMSPTLLVAELVDLGVEPIFINVACKRLAAQGGEPSPALTAEAERATTAFIEAVVSGL